MMRSFLKFIKVVSPAHIFIRLKKEALQIAFKEYGNAVSYVKLQAITISTATGLRSFFIIQFNLYFLFLVTALMKKVRQGRAPKYL